MKAIFKNICFAFTIVIAATGIVNAQPGECDWGGCMFLNVQHPSGPALTTTSSTFTVISTSMTAGKFALCNVVAGTTYEWSMCGQDGGFENFDGQLTLFDNLNNELCYSDDVCGMDPKINWTATFSGTVKIQLNEYDCIVNNSSATLVWRAFIVVPGGECIPGGCAFLNEQYPSGPPLTATPQTFSTITNWMWAGEFALCNVVLGANYEWSLCSTDGGSTSYNSELTLYDGTSNAIICYSNNYCGNDAKISWTATFTGTVKVQVNEFSCATNITSTTLRWRSVGPVTPTTDLAVSQAYTMGTVASPYSNPHVVSALIYNNGTTFVNSQVTLNVSGANSFSNTQSVINLAPGNSVVVNFSGFSSSNIGTNNINVSVPNDDNNNNNSFVVQQVVNTNSMSYAYGNVADLGDGFGGSTGEVAVKFHNSSPTTINQVKTTFFNGGASYKVKVWNANGPGGTPGTLLYTSATTPTVNGVSTVNISPAVNVNGNFYIGAEDVGTIGYMLGFQFEFPVRQHAFYYTSPTGGMWDDFYTNVDLRPMIEPVFACVPPSNLLAISGPNSVCPGSVNTYQVPSASGVATYHWTLPSGWSGSNTSNQINITAGTSSGNITVYGMNACGTTATVSFPVSILHAPAQPLGITGNDTVCSGVSYLYSIDIVPGATSYTWTFPAGWSGASTSNFISVIAGATSGIISVKANNSTCSGPAQSKGVLVRHAPASTGTISGATISCSNTSQVYSVAPVASVSNYNWNLPAGWSGTSVTNSINVTTGTGIGQVSVIASNGCGSSNASNLTVSVVQAQLPVITLSNNVLSSSTATTYQWYLDGSIITGATAQKYSPLIKGSYTVIVTDANGCSATSDAFLFDDVSVASISNEKEMLVFPNPARDQVNITLKGWIVEAPVYITNIIGVTIKVIPPAAFNAGPTFTFDTSDLNSGVYFINAKSADRLMVKKFVIQK
ncbi:MAG: T9SS type A sorting domain-containing protein [Bacteroidetes bacterium]|nr:T9SS type A sorting domain-containing protein [Bacteroidota bacterium]